MSGKKSTGIHADYDLSSSLQDIVGKKTAKRYEVVKALWSYAKKNNLQDPKDGRYIIPDEKFAAVLGTKERIHGFKMNKHIEKHLTKK